MSLSILSKRAKLDHHNHTPQTPKYSPRTVLRLIRPNNSILTNFDDRQISEQLSLQFKSINEVIASYKKKMSQFDRPHRQDDIKMEVIDLQQVITSRDQEIKELNLQIANLKSAKGLVVEKLMVNESMFKLAQELREQRLQLTQIIKLHEKNVEKCQQKKSSMILAEKEYKDKCKKNYIDYQYFKIKELQNKIYIFQNKHKKGTKLFNNKNKLDTSLEKIINNLRTEPDYLTDPYAKAQNHKFTKKSWQNSSRLQTNNKIQTIKKQRQTQTKQRQQITNNIKTMKQLQGNILITTTAIKNNKKKHRNQIFQFNAKLEFLRNEDTILNQKIAQTYAELDSLQLKLVGKASNRSEPKLIGKSSPSYFLYKKT